MRSNERGKGYLWNDDEGDSDAKGYAAALRTVCENWRGDGDSGVGSISGLGSWLASTCESPLLNIQEIYKPLF